MATEPFNPEIMAAHGAPDWRPNNTEALVEAALTCEPEERFEFRLSQRTGHSRQARNFYRLVGLDILRYVDTDPAKGSLPNTRVVEFTEGGLAYVKDRIDDRVERLHEIQQAIDQHYK